MREILFRGKRKDNGKWVCGSLIYDYEQNEGYIAEDFEDRSAYINEVEPSTISEYTGLTDKNGTKIFEGDIVRNIYNDEELTGKIEYLDGSFGVRFADGSGQFVCFFTNCEVIGNIHDNPELLRGDAE